MKSSHESLSSLAVIVVNFGSHDIVEVNLRRTLGADFPGQVIVVDNFSSEDEARAIADVCTRNRWDLLVLPTNEGFGGGNNRAAARAIGSGARDLLFVNPDAWLTRDAIIGLQAVLSEDRTAQIAPLIVRPDGSLYSAEVDLHLRRGEMRSAAKRPAGTDPKQVHTWVSGACFIVGAEMWEAVGGFDEEYFLYWEDVDLSRRIVEVGGSVRVERTLEAVHDEGTTHRVEHVGRAKSPTYYYYNTRNRLVYAAKWLSARDSLRWVISTPRASYRILLQGGRRQFARPIRTLWPAVRGSFDGVRVWRRGRS